MNGETTYPNIHVWLDQIQALLDAVPADDKVKDARKAVDIMRQMLTPPAPGVAEAASGARAEGVKLIYLLGWMKAGVSAGQSGVSADMAGAAGRAMASLETILSAPDPVSVLDCEEYMSRPSPCPPARPGI